MRSLKHQDDYWFILIDQFEELFTTTESDKRDVFIQGLVNLVNTLSKKSDHSVKLVATMRTDFL
ncbi:nSTAND1 domain-containing NTPase [Coleofasciculus sp.]